MNVVSTKNIEIIDSSLNDVEEDDKGKRRNAKTTNAIKKEVAKELSCRNTCRCRGIGIFMLLIAVIIFMAIITIQFTSNMDGPFALLSTIRFAWVFLVLTIMYILLALWIIIRWKPNMKEWIEENYNNRDNNNNNNNSQNNYYYTFFSKIQTKYETTIGLNGKFYLWQLSMNEVIENWIQYYNLRSVFLCNLPFEWTSFICLILVFESGGRAYVYGKRLWFSPIDTIRVIDRDKQILSDMFVDLFFLILPLALMRLVYDSTSIVPTVALQIILPPGFSLFGKIRFTVLQTMRSNIDNMIVAKQNMVSSSIERRRISIYGRNVYLKIERLQNKHLANKYHLDLLEMVSQYLNLLQSL